MELLLNPLCQDVQIFRHELPSYLDLLANISNVQPKCIYQGNDKFIIFALGDSITYELTIECFNADGRETIFEVEKLLGTYSIKTSDDKNRYTLYDLHSFLKTLFDEIRRQQELEAPEEMTTTEYNRQRLWREIESQNSMPYQGIMLNELKRVIDEFIEEKTGQRKLINILLGAMKRVQCSKESIITFQLNPDIFELKISERRLLCKWHYVKGRRMLCPVKWLQRGTLNGSGDLVEVKAAAKYIPDLES